MYQEEDEYDMFNSELKIEGLRFVLTCSACPEQYDVFLEKEQVGYVRLRWGTLRADYPDVGGETIYKAEIGDGERTGCFKNDKERMFHLTEIAKVLNRIKSLGLIE